MPTKSAKPKPAVKKKAAPVKKPAVTTKRPVVAVPTLEPEMMNDLLLAIHEKATEIDEARVLLDTLISESDVLIREAVDWKA